MRRRWLTLFSGLSLALFLAGMALWVRSCFIAHCIVHQRNSPDRLHLNAWTVVSNRGHLYISLFQFNFRDTRSADRYRRTRGAGVPDGFSYTSAKAQPDAAGLRPPWHGFAWKDEGPIVDSLGTIWWPRMLLPLWLPAVLTASVPVFWLWSRRRYRRRMAHIACYRCGYDLRASTERCPECGTPIPPPDACSPHGNPPIASAASAQSDARQPGR